MKKGPPMPSASNCVKAMSIQGQLLSTYSANDLLDEYTVFHFRYGSATTIAACIRFLQAAAVKYHFRADIDVAEAKYEATITIKNKEIARVTELQKHMRKTTKCDA